MNKVILIGNLVAPPQERQINSINSSLVVFDIAVNDSKNGETYFFPCVAWNNQANFIKQYLGKGDCVAIDGRLVRRSYLSREGKTVYITEVVVDNIRSLINRNRQTNNHIDNHQVKETKAEIKKDEQQINTINKEVTDETANAKDDLNDTSDLDWINEINKEE